MLAALLVLLRSLALIRCGHRAVALENLALRQQLAMFRRTAKRPPLRHRDRLLWILLAKAWREWRMALIVVQPDTVVRWHRQSLRRRWTQLSTPTRPGRPSTPVTIRTLVEQMALANPSGGHSNPRGVGQAGHRGIGADCLAAPAATTSPTVTDLANVPDESRGRSGVDGFLHRADPHRPRAIRARAALPPPSPDRAPRDHQAPYCHVDRATDH